MCGICGAIGPEGRAGIEILDTMTSALHHRGPDDQGVWAARIQTSNGPFEVGFGHARLSILDLSSSGHQPMTSEDGQVTITYNGEVYNYRELRKELEESGASFRSSCDTEVILKAYRAWGTDALSHFVGMFSFAIWDNRLKRLVLARDRLGIKPLVYRFADGILTFSSELQSLRQHPAFKAKISTEALGNYFRYGNITGRQSIYEDTYHLAPGELLVWQDGAVSRSFYWKIADYTRAENDISFKGAVDSLEEILGEAVACRMISDVPLGAFLSGGIDSTAVVALMQEHSTQPVKTFSIGFQEEAYNESKFASSIAQHLRTDHTELYVQRDEARSVAMELPDLYDEPFADSSAIPTTLLSRLTRKHVTVSLSGDGGDELFGGYVRYQKFSQLNRLRCLPTPLCRLLASIMGRLSSHSIENGLRALARAHDSFQLAEHFVAHSFPSGLIRKFDDRTAFPSEAYSSPFHSSGFASANRRMMVAEACTYMVDDILTKVDRASMSISLEARVPILDHRVVEFAMSLPLKTIWHGGLTKAPLRELVYRRVPRHLIDRPKKGFGIPIHSLLERELRDWKKRYLAPARIEDEGFFDISCVREMLATSERLGTPGAEYLWPLLCFQRWFARHHRGEDLS